jgi:ubiquinone/menaquinone biosynthesis C-methylase UbiE
LTMARVKPGMKVLEFGSGWGGMAIEVGPTSHTGDEPCIDKPSGRPFVWRRG